MQSDFFFHATCLALAATAFGGAFYSGRKGKTHHALLFILAGAFCLRLLPWADPFLHPWDERYHALVARNLMRHPLRPTLYDDPVLPYDFRDWGGNHVWLHKPPLTLWLMAGSMALFGGNELALRLPSLILSTASVYLTYRVCRRVLDERSAIIAAALHGMNGLLITLATGRTATDHVDTVFFFLVSSGATLSVLYRERRSWSIVVLIGLLTGLAVLTKWMAGLLILPLWACLATGRERARALVAKLFVLLAVAAAIVLPWQWHLHSSFPLEAAWESQYNLRHLIEPLEGHEGSPIYYLKRLPRFFGELVYLPLAWFLFRSLRKPRSAGHGMIALWFTLPLLIYSLSATKMPGYVMVAAPAVFCMVGKCVVALWSVPLENRRGWVARAIAVLLLVMPVRYAMERIKPFHIDRPEISQAEEMRQLRERVGDAVVFNTPQPIEMMFYTGATAYSGLPDSTTIAHLKAQGRRVVVMDDGSLPALITRDLAIERRPSSVARRPASD